MNACITEEVVSVTDAPATVAASGKPGFIDISEAELNALIERIEEAIAFNLALKTDDYRLLINALGTLATMHERLQSNDLTLRKLRKLLGIVCASEKGKDLKSGTDESSDSQDKDPADTSPDKPRKPRPKPRKPPTTAPVPPERIDHPMSTLQRGECCPECARGKVYKHEPAVLLRITGHSPYSAQRHICEQMRCNGCGQVFTADLPAEVLADGGPRQMYGNSARSAMCLYKYFSGEPFYRQQSLQNLFGIHLVASTIFEQCEYVANDLQPIWRVILSLAANAGVFHIDDTTHRILDQKGLHKPRRGSDKLQWRTGVYTSAMLALYEEHDDNGVQITRRLVLFQTSIGHAGEWADEVLAPRCVGLPAPTIMSDALSSNRVSVTEVIEARCNVHCRRNFVEVRAHYLQAVDAILDLYKQVWINDAHCREQSYSDEQRQHYHFAHSLPVMQTLKHWYEMSLLEEPPVATAIATAGNTGAVEFAPMPTTLINVEPNSNLGKAIAYFLNHYVALTRFCHIPGIPIDNNEIERMIKLPVRNRKNAGFFKTQAGAWIGDMLTSMIAICQENAVNAFDYLTAVQCNRDAVRADPEQWLPWNYPGSP